MKIILAVDRDFGIGKDNKLLFHLKKDFSVILTCLNPDPSNVCKMTKAL